MDPSQYPTPTALLVEMHATVLTSWRDYDGYGNTDTDFWTMNLRVPSWPSKSDTLKARFRSDDALDSNALYSIIGRMYVDPGKEWTDTYLRIDSAKRFHGPGTIRSDMQPAFEVVADIKMVCDTHFIITWFTWDDYQNAAYDQGARMNLTRRIPRSHTFVNVWATIKGVMKGPDHRKEWQCIYIDPEINQLSLSS